MDKLNRVSGRRVGFRTPKLNKMNKSIFLELTVGANKKNTGQDTQRSRPCLAPASLRTYGRECVLDDLKCTLSGLATTEVLVEGVPGPFPIYRLVLAPRQGGREGRGGEHEPSRCVLLEHLDRLRARVRVKG